jgi:hypothetical protein
VGAALLASLAGLVLLAGMALLAYRFQWWALIVAAPLCAAAFVLSLEGLGAANMITPLVIGTAGGLMLRKGMSLTSYILAVTLVMTVAMSGNYYVMLKWKNVDLLEVSRAEVAAMMDRNSAPQDVRETLLSDFDRYRETIRDAIPFFFFMNALALSALAYVGMKAIAARLTGAAPVRGWSFSGSMIA